MDINVLEKSKEKLTVEVKGETHTFLNLLRENAWKADAKQAAYILEHPYLSQPKVIVRSKDPKKTLATAAQLVIDQTKEMDREFSRAARK